MTPVLPEASPTATPERLYPPLTQGFTASGRSVSLPDVRSVDSEKVPLRSSRSRSVDPLEILLDQREVFPCDSSESDAYKTKPLLLADDEKILVVCCPCGHQGIGNLTDNGAKLLREANPELFATEDDARKAYNTLGFKYRPYDVSTLEYQAIARLIQQHQTDGSFDVILQCGPYPSFSGDIEVQSAARVTEIPFGVVSHGFLSFCEYDNEFSVDHRSFVEYDRFLKERAFTSNLRATMEREDWSDRKKVETVLLLFPPDKEHVTLDELIQNADCLVGQTYEQSKSSFQEQADKQNVGGSSS